MHDDNSASLEMENSLRDFFKANKDNICTGLSFAVELLSFGKWSRMLLRARIKTNDMHIALQNKLKGTFAYIWVVSSRLCKKKFSGRSYQRE